MIVSSACSLKRVTSTCKQLNKLTKESSLSFERLENLQKYKTTISLPDYKAQGTQGGNFPKAKIVTERFLSLPSQYKLFVYKRTNLPYKWSGRLLL